MSAISNESNLLSIIPCFLLSGLFVGGLYVWDSKYDRNHPSTIKKRFFSIFIVILISPFVLKYFIASPELKKFTVFELIGLRSSGLIPSAVIPLILTMVLFLGPLCMLDFFVFRQSFLSLTYWSNNLTNLIWIRNIIVGPFAEEFTFRACMVPLLLQCFKPSNAIFVCSLFFGVAHTHHVIERFKAGEALNILIIRAIVQFFYTTVFGAYSAFIFLQTGHFIAPFIVHSFCNAMGFPDFNRIFIYDNPKKSILLCLFVIGVVSWYFLLNPLLNHKLYGNYVYFNDEVIS